MTITERESLASLRVLAAMVRSDGVVAPRERGAMQAALVGVQLPEGHSVESLLAEPVDLDAELRALTTDLARDAAYAAAYSLANADGACAPEEQELLERVRDGLRVPADRAALLGRAFSEAHDAQLGSAGGEIEDPLRRDRAVRERTLEHALDAALVGAIPVPVVTIAADLAVVALQGRLVRDIGRLHGVAIDAAAARNLLQGAGAGTGARIAVNSLARLIPGSGSAVGARSAFASTWAVGRLANKRFAGDAATDPARLREAFLREEREAARSFEEYKVLHEVKLLRDGERVGRLGQELAAGRIGQAEYLRRLAEAT